MAGADTSQRRDGRRPGKGIRLPGVLFLFGGREEAEAREHHQERERDRQLLEKGWNHTCVYKYLVFFFIYI